MTRSKELPSKEMLDELLDYDEQSGALKWRSRDARHFPEGGHKAAHNAAKWSSKWAGKPALAAKHSAGYCHGQLMGQMVLAHRVVWKIMTGEDANQVDHINGDRRDNRFVNLRSVTAELNQKNKSRRVKAPKSPFLGVRKTTNGGWQAYLNSKGKFVGFGTYATPEEAQAARKAGEIAFGFHENHGRSAQTEE